MGTKPVDSRSPESRTRVGEIGESEGTQEGPRIEKFIVYVTTQGGTRDRSDPRKGPEVDGYTVEGDL